MSTIIYQGIFQENREVYSTYLLDYISMEDLRKFRNELSYDNVHLLDEEDYQARLQTLVVKRYIQFQMPLLWQWLKEMKIPFGGIIDWKYAGSYTNTHCSVKLLLFHHTQEDLAFRLCYNVTMEET